MTLLTAQAEEKSERAELILEQLNSLPTLPAVATRLLELTIASDSNAREVTRLIESDQSLAAKILSMTRRAHTGLGARVETVDRAVILLGFEAVRNACLSVKVFEVFARSGERIETHFDRTEFWKHSLAVGCGAQLAAEVRGAGFEPEHAFLCGLLHDLGKVALDTCMPKSYDRVVRRTDAIRGCIADVERELLGVDHTVAGHRIAQRWRLPPSITDCIWLHHQGPEALPDSVQHAIAIKLVHFADRLARELRIGYSGNYASESSASALAARIGLTPKQYEQIVSKLTDRIEERAHLIGLDRLTSQDVYLRALTEANEELSRINARMAEANARLSVRSRYFAALNEMNQRLVRSVTLGDVCLAATEAMKAALQSPTAATFFCSSATGLLHVGMSGSDERRAARSVTWDAGALDTLEGWGGDTSGKTVTFLPCAIAIPTLAKRVQAELGTLVPWLCPLFQDEVGVAGVLLAGHTDAASEWAQDAEELVALRTAIRLWLTNIETQQQAQRLNEGLTEINRRLQQAQAEAARMRSIGMIADMAAGAAHELNNPLAVISGRSQMLRDNPPDEATGRVSDVLAEQAQRCSEIVSELMEFARPSTPDKHPIGVGALLERVRDAWLERSSLGAEQFVLELSDELPYVFVDASHMQRALDEIIRNAVESATDTPLRLVVNCQWDSADERVVIRVQDNGCGMGPDVMERAIDPFFSHRAAGRGRGLGLSRAVRWIDINGGHLRLDSQPGEGTTVLVDLPVYDESSAT